MRSVEHSSGTGSLKIEVVPYRKASPTVGDATLAATGGHSAVAESVELLESLEWTEGSDEPPARALSRDVLPYGGAQLWRERLRELGGTANLGLRWRGVTVVRLAVVFLLILVASWLTGSVRF